ncbi:hypothetical protein [Paractinoplanes durhamensis]|uniref:hypothetical protein n=1 Tax=Paractinoplanes durhamensis TaxID=113563 RepID=UPI00362AD70B
MQERQDRAAEQGARRATAQDRAQQRPSFRPAQRQSGRPHQAGDEPVDPFPPAPAPRRQ